MTSNRPRPRAYIEGPWGFQLRDPAGDRTRLIVGGHQVMRPRWLERFSNCWVYVPVVRIMQVRMLAGLKSNIERAAQTRFREQRATADGEMAIGALLTRDDRVCDATVIEVGTHR